MAASPFVPIVMPRRRPGGPIRLRRCPFEPLARDHRGVVMPDELRLRKARRLLSDFSTLWRNPAVPDRLREEALCETFARFDMRGPDLIAAHLQPNENAWLLGYAAMRQQRDVGMVGARGIAPP